MEERALGLYALGDIVEAIDRARDCSSLIQQRSYIHDDDHARAVRPFDMNFAVVHPRDLAGQHIAHGTLLVGHKTAVWAVQLERPAEPLIGIPPRRSSAPQFNGALVVFLDDTRGITGIDGDGGEVEQGAIALLCFEQRIWGTISFELLQLGLVIHATLPWWRNSRRPVIVVRWLRVV